MTRRRTEPPVVFVNQHIPEDLTGEDPTNPGYYTQGEVECIDAIKSALGREQFIGFLRGQVIKYHWRVGLKGVDSVTHAKDVRKAIWYAEKLAEELEDAK